MFDFIVFFCLGVGVLVVFGIPLALFYDKTIDLVAERQRERQWERYNERRVQAGKKPENREYMP